MANLPRLSNSETANLGDFSSEFSKFMSGSFAKANRTMTAINARFIDDTIKVTADMIKVDQEEYQKSINDLKDALANPTAKVGDSPLKVEITNYHFITDKLDAVIGKIDLLSLKQSENPAGNPSPSEEESPSKPDKKKRPRKQEEEEKKNRSLFSKFLSFVQLSDNKRKMKPGGAMDEDWLRKGGALASLLLNPSEHVSVMSRMLVGRLLLKLNASLFALINGIIGATFSTLGGLAAVIIGSVFSTAMLKTGIATLAAVIKKFNPLTLILTGLGTMVYDAVNGWLSSTGSMTDKAKGALKSAFLDGGLFKMTGKYAAMGAAIGSVVPVIGTIAGGIIGSVIGLVLGLIGGDKIAAWTSTAWEALKQLPEMIWNGMSGLYDWANEKIVNIIDWITAIPGKVTGYIDQKVNESEAWFNENVINPVINKLSEWQTKILNFVQPAIDLFNTASDLMNNFSVDDIKANIQESIDKFFATFDWITGAINRWFTEKVDQLRNLKNRILGIFNFSDANEELDKIETVELTPESREAIRKKAAEVNQQTILDRQDGGNEFLDSMNALIDKNQNPSITPNSTIRSSTSALNDYHAGVAAAQIAANFIDNSKTNISNTSVSNQSNTSVNTPLGPIDRYDGTARTGF